MSSLGLFLEVKTTEESANNYLAFTAEGHAKQNLIKTGKRNLLSLMTGKNMCRGSKGQKLLIGHTFFKKGQKGHRTVKDRNIRKYDLPRLLWELCCGLYLHLSSEENKRQQ